MSAAQMDWIEDQLSRAPAPNTIIHLGAGLCRELPYYVQSGAERIMLVEPNPEVLADLESQTKAYPNVQVLPAAVAAEQGRRTLRIYNYPDLSSLRQPNGLLQLLPGLQQTGQVVVEVIAAHKLPEQLGLKNEENNWLIIDTPGEEAAIISALERHNKLNHFDRIIVRTVTESLYEHAPAADQLTTQLQQLGYFMEGAADTEDPDWSRYHFRLNPKAQECRRLRRQVEALTEEKKKLERHNQELAEEKSTLEKRNNGLAEQAARHKSTEELLEGLQKTLTQKIQQSRIQIESYIALNKYLDYGELMPALHGWTISPDLAVYLVEMLENENYDLIIEFGSGSSTVLLAQAMEKRATQTPKIGRLINQLALQGRGAEGVSGSHLPTQTENASHEIPNRILAFEHSRKYLQQTERMLSNSGVRHFVDLEYAPLKDFKWKDQQYLFYDCLDSLERAARLLQRERSKVLVLVDGPPGNANLNARYPALPVVLEHFSKDSLHVVLDDCARKEEKDILRMWESDLDRRGLTYSVDRIPLEKGACLLCIA